MFDIDLESEDVSDAEVSFAVLMLKPKLTIFSNYTLFLTYLRAFFFLQDDVCNFTVAETEPYVFLMLR